jgi:hypothetical protein
MLDAATTPENIHGLDTVTGNSEMESG